MAETVITPAHCPDCNQTDEQCADGRQCSRWRDSLRVCCMFGTRNPDGSVRNG